MTLFETLTGATVKDCVQEDGMIGFLVNNGTMGLAIGKNGANIERVRKALGKGVWVMEFSDNPSEFVKNLFQPIRVRQVRIHDANGSKLVVVEINRRDKKRAIGHDGSHIKIARKLAKRHHGIEDIRVKGV